MGQFKSAIDIAKAKPMQYGLNYPFKSFTIAIWIHCSGHWIIYLFICQERGSASSFFISGAILMASGLVPNIVRILSLDINNALPDILLSW